MNTDCPLCGANGMVARVEVLDLYRCTNRKCRAEYRITPKCCRLCGDWVNDDRYEYCPFHAAYYGEIQETPPVIRYCSVCLNPAIEDSNYCREHEQQFNDEHQEMLRRFHEELQRYRDES